MLKFLLSGVAALALLSPAMAWWPRQVTTVQYAAPAYSSYYVAPAPMVSYYAPAPVYTSFYAAPAPVYVAPAPVYTSYYAAPAPVVSYYTPAVVTTTYTYRAPLFPRRWAAPVVVVGP